VKQQYIKKKANGIRFLFKFDQEAPDLLHIYARHLMTPDDAIETFFSGLTVWNAEYKRFETRTMTHVLYWFWLVENEKAMVHQLFPEIGGSGFD
jgi:hypothetical protein